MPVKVRVETIIRFTLIYPDKYPGDLTRVKERFKEKFHLKTIAIKNLLNGNKVILEGMVDKE